MQNKAFDKIKYPFMIKTLKKLRVVKNFLNLKKFVNNKVIGNIIYNDERLKAFSLRPGRRQIYPLSLLFFNIVRDILTRRRK